MRTEACFIAALAVAPFAVETARAELLEYQFSGQIDWVADEDNMLGDAVQPGDPFSGSYVFDPDSPDLLPDDPNNGWYVSPDAAMAVALGDLTFSAPGTHSLIEVIDYNEFDQLELSAADFTWSGLSISYMRVLLNDHSGQAFVSDGLPIAPPPDLMAFDERYFSISSHPSPGTFFKLGGTVQSFIVVPEAATGVLLAIGGLLVCRPRRYA